MSSLGVTKQLKAEKERVGLPASIGNSTRPGLVILARYVFGSFETHKVSGLV
jgi:hypothetical protein